MFRETQREVGQARVHDSFTVSARRRVATAATVIAGLALSAFAPLPARAARDAQPALQIPLTPLGYQPLLPEFLASGSSLMSVHFVSNDRLLVTFGERKLIQREADDPPDDYDRIVGAFYVDIPTGKVLARTEWRLHDRGQYLWDLGKGRFLLRVRDRLSLLDPLQADRPENAFHQGEFLQVNRRIVAINVSPEHDLLTVESADRDQVVLGDSGQTASTTRTPVQISFYRLVENGARLLPSTAGNLRAPVPLSIPVTSSGYLDAAEGKHDRWIFHFNSAGGKTQQLAAFDTSCAPHPMFVSRSEFVAFGCLGNDGRQAIAGFSLNGDFMWQQGLDTYIAPNFEFAPQAGRFVMERTLLANGASGAGELSPSAITGQEIRVYQTYSGKVLLRLSCVPAVKAGQNFALSPDGMKLAVLREAEVQHKATKSTDAYVSREAAVEVYELPELSAEDKSAVAEARQLRIPTGDSNVELAAHQPTAIGVTDTPAPEETVSPAVPASPASAQPADQQTLQESAESSGATEAGDVQPTAPRKPPTLYAPGEAPASRQSGK